MMARFTIRCVALRAGLILTFLLIICAIYWLQQNSVRTLRENVNDCALDENCDNKIAIKLEVLSSASMSRLFTTSAGVVNVNPPTPGSVRRVLKSAANLNYGLEKSENPAHKDEVSLPSLREETEQQSSGRVLTSRLKLRRIRQTLNCSDCSPSLLRSDGFVRNCIGGNIIGKVPAHLKMSPVIVAKGKFAESAPARRKSFKQVFDSRAWGHGWDAQFKGLNASGMGATLNWAQETIATLHAVIDQLKQLYGLSRVRLLDVPCGDMAWMSRFLTTRTDVDYTGVDIVPDLIRHHNEAFAGRRWKFVLSDVVHDGIDSSNGSYDLVLCRTLLQHLYFPDVHRLLSHMSVLANLVDRPVYLLTTTFAGHSANDELVIDADNPGRFRRLNLEIPPISLSPPLCITRDGPPDAYDGWNHFIGLWKLPLRHLSDCWKPTTVAVEEFPHKLFSCVDWSVSAKFRASS